MWKRGKEERREEESEEGGREGRKEKDGQPSWISEPKYSS